MNASRATATILAALLCAVSAGCGQPSGPGLTGATRDSFIQSSTASCKQAAQSDPRNANVGADKIGQYCTCYSAKMADTISYAELVELDAKIRTDPAGAQAKMQPRIDAAATSCANGVMNRQPQ